MQNRDVAHGFFYWSGNFYRRSMTVSFENNKYFSYSTCIAKIAGTRTGRDVLLVSSNNFSNTTAKHISELRQANPYYEIIDVPQCSGSSDFFPQEVLNRCYSDIEYYSHEKMSLKPNREQFSYYYETLQALVDVDGFDVDLDILNKHKELYETINNPEELAKLKAKQAQADKKLKEQLKLKLEELIAKFDVAELAQMAYCNLKFEHKADLKKYLNPHNELSFIWFDGECVKTSQGITVNRREVEALLKLWQKGKLEKGMTISNFVIIEIKPEYVKVGCHKIPTENLTALYNQIKPQKKKAA